MYKSVPTLQDIFNMAGMQLPEYLKGKDIVVEEKPTDSKKTTTSKKKEE